MPRRPTLTQIKKLTASLRAERIATKPLADAVEAAKSSGNRDAWFSAVNELRAAMKLPAMSLAEFDSRNPK